MSNLELTDRPAAGSATRSADERSAAPVLSYTRYGQGAENVHPAPGRRALRLRVARVALETPDRPLGLSRRRRLRPRTLPW